MILRPLEHNCRRSSCQHEDEIRALSAPVTPGRQVIFVVSRPVPRQAPMFLPSEGSTVCRHRERPLQRPTREQIAHEHRETAVSGQGDDLTTGMTDRGTNRLWEGIRHGHLSEGAEEPPLAVHRQVTRHPDRRGADIASKNGVLGGKLVEHSDHILRIDTLPTRSTGRQVIEALPCLLIRFE